LLAATTLSITIENAYCGQTEAGCLCGFSHLGAEAERSRDPKTSALALSYPDKALAPVGERFMRNWRVGVLTAIGRTNLAI